MAKILLIEDDLKISDFLITGLSEEGHSVIHFSDGLKASKVNLGTENIELMILDLMLPGMDGLSLLENFREQGFVGPILILSAKHTVDDRVQGLLRGGDDYLVKPFALSELSARILVLLKRHAPRKLPDILEVGNFSLDLVTRTVLRNGKAVELPPNEFKLLKLFMEEPEKIISKDQILNIVYGYNFDPQTNIVDVLVCRLRNKLDRDGVRSIHTIRGLGYKFSLQAMDKA